MSKKGSTGDHKMKYKGQTKYGGTAVFLVGSINGEYNCVVEGHLLTNIKVS